jgi:hypothetical protein
MLEVKFEEEAITPFRTTAPRGIVGWVMETFHVESESQAHQIILGFVAFCIVLSGFIIFSSGSSQEVELPRDPRTGEILLEGRRPGYF